MAFEEKYLDYSSEQAYRLLSTEFDLILPRLFISSIQQATLIEIVNSIKLKIFEDSFLKSVRHQSRVDLIDEKFQQLYKLNIALRSLNPSYGIKNTKVKQRLNDIICNLSLYLLVLADLSFEELYQIISKNKMLILFYKIRFNKQSDSDMYINDKSISCYLKLFLDNYKKFETQNLKFKKKFSRINEVALKTKSNFYNKNVNCHSTSFLLLGIHINLKKLGLDQFLLDPIFTHHERKCAFRILGEEKENRLLILKKIRCTLNVKYDLKIPEFRLNTLGYLSRENKEIIACAFIDAVNRLMLNYEIDSFKKMDELLELKDNFCMMIYEKYDLGNISVLDLTINTKVSNFEAFAIYLIGGLYYKLFLYIFDPKSFSDLEIFINLNCACDFFINIEIKQFEHTNLIIIMDLLIDAKNNEELIKHYSKIDVLLYNLTQQTIDSFYKNNSIKLKTDEIFTTTFSNFNAKKYTDLEANYYYSIFRSNEDNSFFFLTNAGCVNQLIYFFETSEKSGSQKKAADLRELYLKNIPDKNKVVYDIVDSTFAANDSDVDANENVRNVMWLVSNCLNFIFVVHYLYYEKYLLNIHSQLSQSVSWTSNHTLYFKLDKSSGEYKHIDKQLTNIDLRKLFEYIPLFKKTFWTHSESKLESFCLDKFFEILELEEYLDAFKIAVKTQNSYIKPNSAYVKPEFINEFHQEKLCTILNKFIKQVGGISIRDVFNKALDLNLTDEITHKIINTLEIKDYSSKDQSFVFICMACIFMRLSSKFYFGTTLETPLALRNFSIAFINRAISINPNLKTIPEPGFWKEKLIGDFCTQMLSYEYAEPFIKSEAMNIFSLYYPHNWAI